MKQRCALVKQNQNKINKPATSEQIPVMWCQKKKKKKKQCISSQESVIKEKQADNRSTRDPRQTFCGIDYSLQSCMVTCPHSEGVNRMMPDGTNQTQGRKRRKHKIRQFMSSEQDAGITSYFQIPMECKEKKLKESKTSKWHGI